MIFLGAGASKVFGLKTLQDMTDLLVEKMRSKGYDDTIEKILKALSEFGLTPDFEKHYELWIHSGSTHATIETKAVRMRSYVFWYYENYQ